VSELPPVPGPGAPAEPLISVGTITALLAAGLAIAVAFGLHLTDDQKGAVLSLIALVAPFVVAVVGRAKVFSPKTVRAMIVAKK
jgi:hypothetical protein